MLFKRIIPIILLLLIISSCGKDKTIEPVVYNEPYYEIDTENEDERLVKIEDIKINLPYSDDYFVNKPNQLNLSLTKISLVLASASFTKYNVMNALTEWGYTNFYYNSQFLYDNDNTKVGFFLSEKVLSDKTIIAVSLRGSYGLAEYANNVLLGLEGDHEGYINCAKDVVKELEEYIENNNIENPVLWIAGYSRGGAVAQAMAKVLPDKYTKYIYSFESPKCMLDDGKDYSFLHNIYLNTDIFTHQFGYGFTYIGNSYNLQELVDRETVLKFVSDNSIDYDIIEFQMYNSFNQVDEESTITSIEFFDLLNKLLYVDKSEINENYYSDLVIDVSKRSEYVHYVQPTIMYFLCLMDKMSLNSMNKIGEYFSNNSIKDVFLDLSSGSYTKVYNRVKEMFGYASISYVASELKPITDNLTKYIYSMLVSSRDTLKTLMTLLNNFPYVVQNHMIYSPFIYLMAIGK